MTEKDQTTIDTLRQNIDLYDTYYQKPDWWFKFRYDTQVKRKTCLHLIQRVGRSLSNQRVLEIGFGSGAVLFSFDPSCEIYGMEISHSAIERANVKADKLGYRSYHFDLVDGNTLPYEDSYFDIVIASHVVEHVENDAELLREIHRTLRDDGGAVILIPINENYNDPNHLHRYTSDEFLKIAEASSLMPVFKLENELLYHFVEKFYFEEYNKRWKLLGPAIAAIFNFPTSVLPFAVYRMIDKGMIALGWKPRQLACVLTRRGDR